jgi:hypothetical protein
MMDKFWCGMPFDAATDQQEEESSGGGASRESLALEDGSAEDIPPTQGDSSKPLAIEDGKVGDEGKKNGKVEEGEPKVSVELRPPQPTSVPALEPSSRAQRANEIRAELLRPGQWVVLYEFVFAQGSGLPNPEA